MYTISFLFVFLAFFVRGTSAVAATITLSPISSQGNVITAGQQTVFQVSVSPAIFIGPCSLSLVQSDSTATMADIDLNVVDEQNANRPLNSIFNVVTVQTTVTITLSTTQDNDPSESLKLRVECNRPSSTPVLLDIEFTINPPANGDGDPHFVQTIVDEKSNISHSICYDVQGESGQVIQIFTDSNSQLMVGGKLLDDYYMHQIFIKFRKFHFKITTKNIWTNLMKMFDWDEVKNRMWTQSGPFLIRRNENYLQIGENRPDSLSVVIYRRRNREGNMYLDVSIVGLKADYAGQDGLIGRIGNNQIRIHDSVQDDELNVRRRIIGIEVNGKEFKGRLVNRSGRDCILIDAKAALYPHRVDSYVEF